MKTNSKFITRGDFEIRVEEIGTFARVKGDESWHEVHFTQNDLFLLDKFGKSGWYWSNEDYQDYQSAIRCLRYYLGEEKQFTIRNVITFIKDAYKMGQNGEDINQIIKDLEELAKPKGKLFES